MPGLDYAKFDHLEDSDDDKPDPKALEAEERRRQMSEEMKKKMALQDEEKTRERAAAAAAEMAKPQHQRDRFAYSDTDASKLAQDTLRPLLLKSPPVKVGSNGMLSLVAVDKVEGEAMKLQASGKTCHTFDVSFKARFAYKWPGANFDAGVQRAEGTITVSDFTDATSFKTVAGKPSLKLAWTDTGALEGARKKEAERSLGFGWPPPEGSLMASVAATMETFVEKLPEVVAEAIKTKREQREKNASQDDTDEEDQRGEQRPAGGPEEEQSAPCTE